MQDIGSKIIWFRNASGESQQLGFAAIYRRSFDEVFGTRLYVPPTVLDNRLSCIIMLNTWPIVALAAIVLYRNIIRSFLPGAKVKLTISGVTVEQLSRLPSTQ